MRAGGASLAAALGVAALGALVLAGLLLWRSDTRGGNLAPEYSVRRTDDLGMAIAYRLFERASRAPRPWNKDFGALEGRGLMLLVEPQHGGEGPLSAQAGVLPHEVLALDRWVRSGNVCVVMARRPNDLFRALGLIPAEQSTTSVNSAVPTQPGVLTRGVKSISTTAALGFGFGRTKSTVEESLNLKTQEPIEPIASERWLPLFVETKSGRRAPQVVAASQGQGLYVAVSDSNPITNLGIRDENNLEFSLNLTHLTPSGGNFWIDEFHKYSAERTALGYLRARSLGAAILYGLLLFGLIVWRAGVRFGSPLPLRDPRAPRTTEYLAAIANLHRSAGQSREALALLRDDFLRRHVGRRSGTTLERVGALYARNTGRSDDELKQCLAETDEAIRRTERMSGSEDRCARAARRLAELDHALSPGRRGERRIG